MPSADVFLFFTIQSTPKYVNSAKRLTKTLIPVMVNLLFIQLKTDPCGHVKVIFMLILLILTIAIVIQLVL